MHHVSLPSFLKNLLSSLQYIYHIHTDETLKRDVSRYRTTKNRTTRSSRKSIGGLPESRTSTLSLLPMANPASLRIQLHYGFNLLTGPTSSRVGIHCKFTFITDPIFSQVQLPRVQLPYGFDVITSSNSLRVELHLGIYFIRCVPSSRVQFHYGLYFITGPTSSQIQIHYGFIFITGSNPLRVCVQFRYRYGFAFIRDSRLKIAII